MGGVALPLVCLVTGLLHYNKNERCKHHVRQLRLEYQRDQLERELAGGNDDLEIAPASTASRGGSSSHQYVAPAGNGSDSAARGSNDRAGSVAEHAAPESSYRPLAGEPAAAAAQ